MNKANFDKLLLTSPQQVATLLRSQQIRPSKTLGQNFLVDRNVLTAIIEQVSANRPVAVVEIGAGLGTMTQELSRIAPTVIAVEIDHRLAHILRMTTGALKNVTVWQGDFLAFDFTAHSPGDKVVVVGNIPYRSTAPILSKIIDNRSSITYALLMTQQEVAMKIAASPGPQGSVLGILVQAYAEVEIIRPVPRQAFYPIPKVDSMVWQLTFSNQPRFSVDHKLFFTIVRALYNKRRKMIRRALRDILPSNAIAAVLMRAEIDPTARGETLSFVELDRLAQQILESSR
ncbi:16S rRNA (adenine(1518)-N(6)/adenine(1519)-N(6))-dimethyltransferase RsmA [Candidatus Bipolaricaulota bacterium]|nr:16S rRNA (adenine(1518)-N(6)/adenine(1519)-N(6))-dimethyltransferase RsmA [Candidatus Bipolaricaulota bacterium]